MAGSDPWVNFPWFKFGPLTLNDEDRVAADRRREELEAQDKVKAQGGIHSLMSGQMPERTGPSLDDPFWNSKGRPDPTGSTMAGQEAFKPEQYPESAKDWSLMQGLTGPSDKWFDARRHDGAWWSGQDEAAKSAVPPGQEAQPQVTEDRADRAGSPMQSPVQQPVQEAPIQPQLSQQQQAVEDIKAQKAMIDQLYPQRTYDDAAQQKADDYAENERGRAASLAQLAFFSGVTKGAGGGWEGVGQGLAGAGNVYAAGFDRYQTALQNKASRANERMEQKYQDGTTRTDAAVKLYSAKADREASAAEKYRTEGRLDKKQANDDIDTYFKEKLKMANGNDMAPPDPMLAEQIMREWRVSRQQGEIIEQGGDLTKGK